MLLLAVLHVVTMAMPSSRLVWNILFSSAGHEFIKDAGVITGERSMQVVRSSPGSHANDLIAGSLLAVGGFLYLPLKTLLSCSARSECMPALDEHVV